MKIKRFIQIAKTITRLYLYKMGIHTLPFSLFWYITWRCNSKCLHCEFGKADSPELKSQEVPLQRVKEVITEAAGWGARHIAFAGGEPFVRNDFLDIIRHCKSEGYVVGVSSNGFKLSDPSFAAEAVASGLDRIDLSLDSPDTLHDTLRGVPGAFPMVDKALDNLLRLRKDKSFYIGVNVVVSGYNIDKLVSIFEYAKKKGIDGVGLQPFHYTQARAKELIPKFLLTREQAASLKPVLAGIIRDYGALLKNSPFFVKNVATFYEDNKMPGYTCYGGMQEVHLFADGTTGVCCFNSGKLSVKDKSLKDILHSDEFKEILRKSKSKECPGCWSPPVHEYNILFKPLEFFSGLKLAKTFLKWTKD